MIHPWHDLTPGKKFPTEFNAVRRFFQDYKQLEKKIVDVEEIRPVETAYLIIEAALEQYAAKYASCGM